MTALSAAPGTAAWLSELVGQVRRTLGVDIASAAVIDQRGNYRMVEHDGSRSPEYRALSIRPGTGLGGLAVKLARPVRVGDYMSSRVITPDYMDEVRTEGLRGLACVPVSGPDGTMVLLYGGNREADSVDDRTLGRLEGLAAATEQRIAEVGSDSAAQAVLAERRRLASELHDSVAQVLFAIAIGADRRGTSPAEHALALERIEQLALAGRRGLRETFADLARPASRPRDDLEQRGAHIAAESGARLDWIRRPDQALLATLSGRARTLLFDTLREGLRNVARHAASPEVIATLNGAAGMVTLTLQSRSRREPLESVHFAPGSGLDLLRVRADELQGDLRLSVVADTDLSLAVLRLALPATRPHES